MFDLKSTACAVGVFAATLGAASAQDGGFFTNGTQQAAANGAANFDGFYLGGAISDVSSDFDKNCSQSGSYLCSDDDAYFDSDQRGFGVKVGYDKRFDDLVLGVSAELDKINGSQAAIDKIAAFKLRAGYVFGDVTMLYASVGRVQATLGEPDHETNGNWSILGKTGLATSIGIGLEHYIGENLSLFGEITKLEFDNLGDIRLGADEFVSDEDRATYAVDTRQIKFGLNYRF